MSSWLHQSPWSSAATHIVGELVALNHARYMESQSPLFWVRALHIGRHLPPPDDARLVWAQTCLADAISRLDALTHQPLEKEKHWDSIIEALGFQMRPNHNPFRELGHTLQRDEVYEAVLRHGKPLNGAFASVARARGLTVTKVRDTYYDARKRVAQLWKTVSVK